MATAHRNGKDQIIGNPRKRAKDRRHLLAMKSWREPQALAEDVRSTNSSASQVWRHPQSSKEARYATKLQTLQRGSDWTKEELDSLNTHLKRFSFEDRMEHLEVLHSLPKRLLGYRKPLQKPTPNRRPWKYDVGLFLDVKPTSSPLPVDVTRLRTMNSAISHRMLKDGWCSSTIQLLLQACHVPGLHLAMLLGRAVTEYGPKKDHSRCSDTQCYALQMDINTFKSSHLLKSCGSNCGSIRADEAEVNRIIEEEVGDQTSEDIPRVVLPLEGEMPTKLNVSNRGQFTAVSHVWAHGLSNRDNSMSACQLDRLRKFLKNRLGQSKLALLWMDSFCIPNGDARLRAKAVSRIAKTFKLASRVLVLDASLLQTSCKASAVEKAIKILSSDWMRRLWTLEEAMLGCADIQADKLYFGFSDGYTTFQSLRAELRSRECPYAHTAVQALERHLTPRIDPGNWQLSHKHSREDRFAEVARAVEFRNTSNPGDEMLCIASILGLASNAIVGADTVEDKAIALYLTLGSIPITALFCAGLRITKAPFRWIPSSFITSENPRKLYALGKKTNLHGQCRGDGLHLRASGILFTIQLGRDPNFNRVWIQPDKLSPEKLILEPSAWEQSYNTVPEWQGWRRLQKACIDSEQLVLLVNPESDHEGVVLGTHAKKNSEEHYVADFLCQVHIGRDRKKQLADVGPIRREETTGYYRLFDDQATKGEDKENDRPAEKETRTSQVRPRRAGLGSEFYRGDGVGRNERGEILRDVRRPVKTTCQGRTGPTQMWIVT